MGPTVQNLWDNPVPMMAPMVQDAPYVIGASQSHRSGGLPTSEPDSLSLSHSSGETPRALPTASELRARRRRRREAARPVPVPSPWPRRHP